MPLITVNGSAIPTPTELSVGIMDLSKAERTAKGLMTIERIATKRKIEMSWAYLSKNDLATLLQAVSGVFFTVVYPDPQTNQNEQKTFYVGDRNIGMLDFINSVPRYKDVKFNFIER